MSAANSGEDGYATAPEGRVRFSLNCIHLKLSQHIINLPYIIIINLPFESPYGFRSPYEHKTTYYIK